LVVSLFLITHSANLKSIPKDYYFYSMFLWLLNVYSIWNSKHFTHLLFVTFLLILPILCHINENLCYLFISGVLLKL